MFSFWGIFQCLIVRRVPITREYTVKDHYGHGIRQNCLLWNVDLLFGAEHDVSAATPVRLDVLRGQWLVGCLLTHGAWQWQQDEWSGVMTHCHWQMIELGMGIVARRDFFFAKMRKRNLALFLIWATPARPPQRHRPELRPNKVPPRPDLTRRRCSRTACLFTCFFVNFFGFMVFAFFSTSHHTNYLLASPPPCCIFAALSLT